MNNLILYYLYGWMYVCLSLFMSVYVCLGERVVLYTQNSFGSVEKMEGKLVGYPDIVAYLVRILYVRNVFCISESFELLMLILLMCPVFICSCRPMQLTS